MQFYVSKDGQRYGPYSLDELRHEVLANAFRPENFASSDNGQTWEPIGAIPGIGPLVYAVEADTANNLLVIRYRDRVGSPDVERCALEVSKALTSLKPAFRLLADFTDLESMDAACATHLRHIMQLCNEKEVSAVVRVIPNPQRDIGLRIMSFFHYGPEVHIVTCATLDEAREILDRRQSQLPGATMASISEPEE
jgi:GYF domain 2